MSKKGEIWSEEECLALIYAWGDEEIQRKLSGTHKNADVYKKISRMMKESGDFDRDWKQCRTKIKHLKTEYKKHKDSGLELVGEKNQSFLGKWIIFWVINLKPLAWKKALTQVQHQKKIVLLQALILIQVSLF